MPGPWITDSELRAGVASMIKRDIDQLNPAWDPIIPDAIQAAADDIAQILQGRGYTPGQIDAWDQRKTYNRDIALFWAFVKNGGLDSYPDAGINKLDRRKELQTMLLLINGQSVAPGTLTGPGAGVRGGQISSAGWRFDMDTRF